MSTFSHQQNWAKGIQGFIYAQKALSLPTIIIEGIFNEFLVILSEFGKIFQSFLVMN
jgi:hypothetical protein